MVEPIVPSSEIRIGVCFADVVDLIRFGEERLDPLARSGAVRAGRVLPDDVDLLAGVAVELPLGEVGRGLGLGPGGVVVGVELPRERGAEPDRNDHCRDPSQDHAAATPVGDIGEACKVACHLELLTVVVSGGAELQVRHVLRVDDACLLELWRLRAETVEEAHASAQQQRRDVNLELVDESGI